MKYKNINSALHNLGHSFVSGMNYVDDDHVFYDLNRAVQLVPNALALNFSTGATAPAEKCTPRILKALHYYRLDLARHLKSHNIDPHSLRDVTLIHRRTTRGYETVMS